MKLAKAVLILSALPFIGVGIAFLLAPSTMAGFVDVELGSATADADVRAVYGGLQIACAALLLALARRERTVVWGLRAQLTLYGGLIAGRLVAWTQGAQPEGLGILLGGAELVALAIGALVLWRLRPGGSAAGVR